MSAFFQASEIEARGIELLMPWFRKRAMDGSVVKTNTGRMSMHLQTHAGDLLLNSTKTGDLLSFEVKVEAENKYKNLFLEEWSNRKRETQGWRYKLTDTDYLAYFFLAERELYIAPWPKLNAWCARNLKEGCPYTLKQQRKYNQLNDTWGWCVPIGVLLEAGLVSQHIVPLPESTIKLVPDESSTSTAANNMQRAWFRQLKDRSVG